MKGPPPPSLQAQRLTQLPAAPPPCCTQHQERVTQCLLCKTALLAERLGHNQQIVTRLKPHACTALRCITLLQASACQPGHAGRTWARGCAGGALLPAA